MTARCRFCGVRILVLLAVSFTALSLFAEEDDAPRKRGGFTGATPKPIVKKSAASAAAAKKKAVEGSDQEDELKPKTAAKKKSQGDDEEKKPALKKAAVEDEEPVRKKKAAQAEESVSDSKKDQAIDAPAKPPKATETGTGGGSTAKREHAPAATVAPEDIAEFSSQPPRVQALITAALELTKLNLTYTYGSDDPAQGGMDCSGTIYHLLHSQGFKDVPRDSSSQYVWTRKGGPFFAVVSKSADSFEFKDLRPGDLMFWTGTYETGREIPVSHVMLYLGTEKKTKKRIMFGSSDGRSYDGVQRWGVSVFDFKMPRAADVANPERAKVDFVGYGRIPALLASAAETPAPPTDVPAEHTAQTENEKPAATPAQKVSEGKSPAGSSSKKGRKTTKH